MTDPSWTAMTAASFGEPPRMTPTDTPAQDGTAAQDHADLIARLDYLTSPSAEHMSDGGRLTALIRCGQEAAAALTASEARRKRAEEERDELRLAGMKAMTLANGALDTTATEKTFRRDLVNIREELRAVIFPARATLAGKE